MMLSPMMVSPIPAAPAAPMRIDSAPIAHAQKGPLPKLRIEGKRFVDPSGKPVLLKGCNLGNWLLIEFWMLTLAGKPGNPGDQYTLVENLKQRFGAAEAERLMDLYRASWMTERDWKAIDDYGFNLVRLPMDYRLMEDDERPMKLRADAWQWIDKAVDEAEKHGLYIILDMHGVQGGQTPNDHTGRSGQNKLWGNEENKARLAWLWKQVAARYKNRNAVVAYDTMNEPYGGTKPEIVEIFDRCYRAIRSVDPDKPVYAHGFYDNFDFFGDPKEHGWKDVGFQMHYYPGLFGSPPGIATQVAHLRSLQGVAKKIDRLNVPFLVGEMNVVLDASGGAAMMRRTFDKHAEYGWSTTMWSYKVLDERGSPKGNFWGMVANRDRLPKIALLTAPKSEIEGYFRSMATMPIVPYAALKEVMTAKNPVLPPLPEPPPRRTKAPADQEFPGWKATDIGGALPGGLVRKENTVELYGGGTDIWGDSDAFRFLHRPILGDFDLSVSLAEVEKTQAYTKAGLMVRSSLDPKAATALISVFPSGEVQVGIREQAGAVMEGINGPQASTSSAKLLISRRGDVLTFSVDGKEITKRALPALAGAVEIGAIALSHEEEALTKIVYRDLRVSPER